jgi:hypothetical protein
VPAIFAWLLTYLLHSTVVVGAVWMLVRSGWVRRPTTQDLLWKVALLSGLFTATVATVGPARGVARDVTVALRGAPTTNLSWERAAPPRAGRITIRATGIDPSPACRAVLERLRSGADVTAVRAACVDGAGGGMPWRGSLILVWLGVAGILVTGAVAARRCLRRALRDATPAPRGVADVARALLASTGCSSDVRVSSTVAVPCVWGGRIVLPPRCVEDLTRVELQAVLAHETAHLVRRDPAWLTLGELITRVLWFQPLNRVAFRGLRESAELVCDDWAVDRTRKPVELAASIARVAEWVHPARRRPALAHLAGLTHGEGRVLSGRVRRILSRGALRRAAPRPLRLALAALVVAPTLALPPVPTAKATFAVFIREEVEDDGGIQRLRRTVEPLVFQTRRDVGVRF